MDVFLSLRVTEGRCKPTTRTAETGCKVSDFLCKLERRSSTIRRGALGTKKLTISCDKRKRKYLLGTQSGPDS